MTGAFLTVHSPLANSPIRTEHGPSGFNELLGYGFGIETGAGVAYYDAGGVAEGEEAIIVLDSRGYAYLVPLAEA